MIDQQLVLATVTVGSRWLRPDGVVMEVAAEVVSHRNIRDVKLIPLTKLSKDGKKPRVSWKWDRAVMLEFEKVSGEEGGGE